MLPVLNSLIHLFCQLDLSLFSQMQTKSEKSTNRIECQRKENKFRTNNDASWMNEVEDKAVDEDEDEDSFLTSEEPFKR